MKNLLKLGTRKSLLAWAQSSWVARQIEALNPGVTVELVGIETQGDRIQDVPLRNVEGKEFFVAELDHALAAGRSDLSVHSMKDLSLDRPSAFVLAAIPPRENPRDIILFSPDVEAALAQGRKLKIGTSSPRRLENIPPFLRCALPHLGIAPEVELVEIRGNVNTRLARVHEPRGSERALDGVVLAFAGLIRLWADDKGRAELSRLLSGVRWMVLPLRENPAAPAQGALAVECRAEDAETRAIVAQLHDSVTEIAVRAERQLLADWGGGCHQRFGATQIETAALGALLYVRGAKLTGEAVNELRWQAPARAGGPTWNGAEHRLQTSETLTGQKPEVKNRAVFVAHARAWVPPMSGPARGMRVWTSGTPSWFKLAARGVWVEGCAEGLGIEFLKRTLAQGVLQLPAFADWLVLTHEGALKDWPPHQAIATYRVERPKASDGAELELLKGARRIYWSSGSQWDAGHALAARDAHHACGPGKTADHLRAQGVVVSVFPSNEEWIQWTKT